MEKSLELTNQQIAGTYNALSAKSDAKNTIYNMFRVMNRKELETIATPIVETDNMLKSILQPFHKERNDLLTKYATKDDKGNPVIKKQTENYMEYDITPENIVLLNEETEKLKAEKFKEDFEKFEAEKQKFDVILKEKQTVKLKTIKKSDLPNDLDDNIIEFIFDLIE